MSSQYDGIPGNVTPAAAATVSAATNASPIVITTTAAHGLTTGDLVQVNYVFGNTAANGVWPAVVVDATHVALSGSTGNGAYVNTGPGTVQSLGFAQTYAIPSDGDARSAASVNVALSALGDRTAMLAASTGQYKYLATVLSQNPDDVGFTTWERDIWSGTRVLSAADTWTAFPAGAIGIIGGGSATGALQVGDLIDVTFTGSCLYADAGSSGPGGVLALSAGFSAFGAANPTPSISTRISGSAQYVSGSAGSAGGVASAVTGVHLRGIAIVPAGKEVCQFQLLCGSHDSTPTNISFAMLGDWAGIYTIYRPTDFIGRLG